MIERWGLCIRCTKTLHPPHLMMPTIEDSYERFEMIQCECVRISGNKYKMDYPSCYQKCPICLLIRKKILAFEYMHVGPLLASLCKKRTLCEKMLCTWRAKARWLGKDFESFVPEMIKEHFDGNKFCEYQAFWDPEAEWEVLIICNKKACFHASKTFPPSKRCDEVIQHWDPEIQH